MLTFSTDPAVAERQMEALIFSLTTFGYIDGDFDDAEKDVMFFADRPDAWTAVGPGAFAVYFPSDAHAPLVGSGDLHKVVVKVLAD